MHQQQQLLIAGPLFQCLLLSTTYVREARATFSSVIGFFPLTVLQIRLYPTYNTAGRYYNNNKNGDKNLLEKAEEYFKVGCIDILVNNAGINTNLGWRKCMEVNIIAVMTGTEIAMEKMKVT